MPLNIEDSISLPFGNNSMTFSVDVQICVNTE